MQKTTKNRQKQILGAWGEDQAAKYLISRGFAIVARNHRTPEGEIDLIALKDGQLVFVEVKTRANLQSGYPEESVTETKLEHMLSAAEYYLESHPEYADDWRVDVIAVTGVLNSQNPQIEWFENAA